MIKYRKITDISLVTDTILIYWKNQYLKCRYDTDTGISISAMYRRYIDPPLVCTVPIVLFSSVQGRQLLNCRAAVKLSGAEAANRGQCAAPDKPIGYWNLLVVFANLKRVLQCACFKSPGSRKGTPKRNLRISAVVQHLRREWRLVFSSSLQRGHNGSLTLGLRIIVRCRLRVLYPVRRYTSVLRSRQHCRKANCVSPGVTRVTSSLVCRQPSVLSQCLLCSLWALYIVMDDFKISKLDRFRFDFLKKI